MIKKIFKALLVITLSIILVLLIIKILELINFNCFYKTIFNIYCAGCGTTRMIKAIFELNFYQAFRYNPLMFILLIILIIYIIYNIILYLKGKPLVKASLKVLILISIILIFYMILRNLPGFEVLLPTNIIIFNLY